MSLSRGQTDQQGNFFNHKDIAEVYHKGYVEETTYGSNNLAAIILVSIGGSAILSRLLKPVLDFSIETTMVSNVLILIIATIIIVYLRLYFRRSLSNRLSGLVDLEVLEPRYIKIKPALFKLGIISYVVILPMLLLSNTSAINPRII